MANISSKAPNHIVHTRVHTRVQTQVHTRVSGVLRQTFGIMVDS